MPLDQMNCIPGLSNDEDIKEFIAKIESVGPNLQAYAQSVKSRLGGFSADPDTVHRDITEFNQIAALPKYIEKARAPVDITDPGSALNPGFEAGQIQEGLKSLLSVFEKESARTTPRLIAAVLDHINDYPETPQMGAHNFEISSYGRAFLNAVGLNNDDMVRARDLAERLETISPGMPDEERSKILGPIGLDHASLATQEQRQALLNAPTCG